MYRLQERRHHSPVMTWSNYVPCCVKTQPPLEISSIVTPGCKALHPPSPKATPPSPFPALILALHFGLA